MKANKLAVNRVNLRIFFLALLATLCVAMQEAKSVERKELKVISPECDEKVPSGSLKLITWSGVASDDSVNILLSINLGRSWDTLARRVTGFSYLAKMPDVESDSCLVRISSTKTVSGSFKLLHNGEINAACFSGNGSYIATFGSDSVATIWNSDSGALVWRTPKHNGKLIAGAIDFYGSYFAVVSSDSSVVVWDLKAGKEQMRLLKLPYRPLCVDFSPTGKYLLLGGLNGSINIYLAPFFSFLMKVEPEKGVPVWDAKFLSNPDRILLTAGGFAQVYDWTKSRSIFKYDTRQGESYGDVRHVSANSDATLFAATSLTSKKTLIFNEGVEQPSGEITHQDTTLKTIITTDFFRDLSFGEVILTAGVDKRAKLSVVSTRLPIAEFIAHSNTVTSAKFHPAGDRILTASLDSTAIVWKGNLDIIADGIMPCPFSLVRQKMDVVVIDFDTAIVTTKVWKTIPGYIKNSSKIAIRIDSVNAPTDSPFKITLEKEGPIVLQPDDSVGVIGLFAPMFGDSLYISQATIFTDNAEFAGALSGYGKELGLVAQPSEISFPLTETGLTKDSLLKSIIFNRSSKNIRIQNAVIGGSNASDFILLNTIDGVSLKPGDSLDLNIRYAPSTQTIHTAHLKINHDGKGDTAIYLFGNAVTIIPDSISVFCRNFSAEAGEIVKTPITVNYPNYAGTPVDIETEIAFNATLLQPIGVFSDISTEKSMFIIRVKYTVNASVSALPLDFRGLLGNDTVTSVSFRNLEATGPGRYFIKGVDGEFNLENYCVEGGVRLFDPFAESRLLTQINSPLREPLEVKFQTRGASTVEISLYSENGEKVEQIIDGFLPKGVHSVTLQPERYAPGFYILTLRSGPDTAVKKIIISR